MLAGMAVVKVVNFAGVAGGVGMLIDPVVGSDHLATLSDQTGHVGRRWICGICSSKT